MNSEQEKELLNYLASLGFTGEKFAAKLQDSLKLNTPSFMVPDKISFGEEQMFFKLHFVKDQQFNAYRLQRYQATHRSPVLPEHTIINGVDTAALEERMKGQDWETYFNLQKDAADTPAIKDMLEITQLLNKLSEGQNFDGMDIQEELMYKYWPAENYFSNGKSDFKTYHEHSRDFSPSEYGICNANLAFHILSGRLNDLLEKTQSMDLDNWPAADLYNKLEQILSGNPENFELRFTRNESEGYSEINIPVITVADEFSVAHYTHSFIPYPGINHGIYNGIDTKVLEDQMREIDWHNDWQLFIFHEDTEPEFTPRVSDIQDQIYRLSQDMAGADIANQLQLKYWADATFFSDMLQQSAWDRLDELPKRVQQFPSELNAKAGYNLLCGRAVPENLMYPYRPESDNWLRLDLNNKDGNGNYEIRHTSGFGKTELENVLDVFPIPNSNYYPVKNGLLRGDLVTVKLANDKKVLLEANPEQVTVNVYTPDMRLIPTNVHLDPDWKPALNEEKNSNQTEQKRPIAANKYPSVKRPQKRKGRGL
jgi:hypothetical protein